MRETAKKITPIGEDYCHDGAHYAWLLRADLGGRALGRERLQPECELKAKPQPFREFPSRGDRIIRVDLASKFIVISLHRKSLYIASPARPEQFAPLAARAKHRGLARNRPRHPVRNLGASARVVKATTRTWSTRMDWNRVEGNWKQTKGKVKEKWGQLTDDDLTQVNGQRDQLEGKIQQRYGLAKDMARKDVDDWLKMQP
jgi:uncharacterized protein YjbJ (UPF0337 family)